MKPKNLIQFKFLKRKRNGLVSKHGQDGPWVIGKWRNVKGAVELCVNGYHCSPTPVQAHRWIATNILAVVQVKGDHKMWDKHNTERSTKSVWRSMKITAIYRVTMADYRAYLKFMADLVGVGFFPRPDARLIDLLKQCRDMEGRALRIKGKHIKNLAAITAWWVARLPEMQTIS